MHKYTENRVFHYNSKDNSKDVDDINDDLIIIIKGKVALIEGKLTVDSENKCLSQQDQKELKSCKIVDTYG